MHLALYCILTALGVFIVTIFVDSYLPYRSEVFFAKAVGIMVITWLIFTLGEVVGDSVVSLLEEKIPSSAEDWFLTLTNSCLARDIDGPYLPLVSWTDGLNEEDCVSLCRELLSRHNVTCTAFCDTYGLERREFLEWMRRNRTDSSVTRAVRQMLSEGLEMQQKLLVLVDYSHWLHHRSKLRLLEGVDLQIFCDSMFVDCKFEKLLESEYLHKHITGDDAATGLVIMEASLASSRNQQCCIVGVEKVFEEICKRLNISFKNDVEGLLE